MNSMKKNPYSELVNFGTKKGKLILSEKVVQQIKYLCSKMPTVEWSGVLYHSSEGDIQNPETFICKAEYILLLDKGSAAYTEYDFSSSNFTEALFEKPELMDLSMAHIHSHNNMNVFFSGTDNEELTDNAPNYNYYLSLIVNNKNEYCAKIAFVGEIEGRTIRFKNKKGEQQEIVSPTKQCTFNYDMEIVTENSNLIDEFFIKQYDKIATVKPVSFNNVNNYSNYYSEIYSQGYNTNISNKGQLKMFDNIRETESKHWDKQAVSFLKLLLSTDYETDDYTNINPLITYHIFDKPLVHYLDELLPSKKTVKSTFVKEFVAERVDIAGNLFEEIFIFTEHYDDKTEIADIWNDCINFLKVCSFSKHPTVKLLIEEMNLWTWQ